MSGEAEVLPGKQFATGGGGEIVDLAKLNALGRPFVRVLENAITLRELDTSITAEIGDLRTDLTTEISSRITADDALALWQTTVEAAYGDNLVNVGVTLSAYADSFGNLDTYWAVALDANGHVIGRIQLSGSVDADTGVVESDFIVVADRFRVSSPADGTLGDALFEVEASTGIVKFAGLVADPAVGLFSDGYTPGSAGFKIGLDGFAEFSDVLIRSALGSGVDGLEFISINNPFEFLKLTTDTPVSGADIGIILDTNVSDSHRVDMTCKVIKMEHNTSGETIRITAEKIQFDGGSSLRGAVGFLYCDGDFRVDGELRAKARINNYTVNTTASLADRSAIVEMEAATAVTYTLPLNATVAFTEGDCMDVRWEGVGLVTVEAVSGVLLNGVDGGSVTVNGAKQAVSVYCRGVDDWGVVGGV